MQSARAKLWKQLIWGLIAVLLVVVLCVGYSVYQTWRLIPESYAAWTTGDLMVEYLRNHTNRWPEGWDDLRSATNSLMERGRPVYWPLDRLPRIVRIDWQADVGELQRLARSGSNAQIRVITRLDGARLRARWGRDTEPNGKIVRYLAKP